MSIWLLAGCATRTIATTRTVDNYCIKDTDINLTRPQINALPRHVQLQLLQHSTFYASKCGDDK